MTTPVEELKVGVMMIVTVAPTEDVALLPAILIVPRLLTEPAVTLPAVVTVSPLPAEMIVVSIDAFSETPVLNELAVNINSETLARIV